MEKPDLIPDFNLSEVLPPFLGEKPTSRAQMSPYSCEMSDFAKRFNTSPQRTSILDGLLDYREALVKAGITEGFQWLDGSFVENVEVTRGRPPGDIDIVTFARRPVNSKADIDWRIFFQTNIALFDPKVTKAQYKCDAYFIDLDKKSEIIVDDSRYFFGLFSHQKVTALWKGMVRVPLESDDAAARLLLYP